MKNMKNQRFIVQQNSKLQIVSLFYFQQLFKVYFYACQQKQPSYLSQISNLHPKSFPTKNNLKIKVVKCLNPVQLISHLHPALLNHCHSPDNTMSYGSITSCWVNKARQRICGPPDNSMSYDSITIC